MNLIFERYNSNSMKITTHLLTCFLFFSLKSQGQVSIPLANPSFEETPDWEQGWLHCNASQATPPVIQPGYFKVEHAASDGNAYLALVVRDDSTQEAVSQKLPVSLQEGTAYQLHADLMRADLYLMEATTKDGDVNYATPVILQIWGGNAPCEKQELLHSTPLITPTRWLTYTMPLEPQKGDYDYLTLAACHKMPVLFPYNGNVLIDNLSLTTLHSEK